MCIPRPLLALLFVPAMAWGQPALRESVTVSYVEVPVTVIGREGGPVRGLTRENFEVLEDGQKREIESFETIDFARAQPLKAISPLNPASRRYFLLVFDLSYTTPTSVGRAKEAAKDFIARSIGSRDLVGVASIDVERGFRFLTAFTTDRELLLAAIAEPVTFRTIDPLQISSASILLPGSQARTMGGRTSSGSLAAEELAKDFARSTTKLDDAYNRTRVKRQVETLAAVAHSLQGLAGRKHLVLLSEGFDPRLVQGRGAGESKEQSEENSAVEFGEIWKVDSDQRFGEASAHRSLRVMAEAFHRADVVLHAVDIQGLRVQNDVRGGSKVNSNEGLFLLANSTGGTVFRNSNDISGEFDKLSRQHEVVYVVGFHAPAGKAGQYHDLKVRLVDVPNARAQYRGGYYDAGGEDEMQRSLSTAEVIVNDIPQDAIGVAALAIPFPAHEGLSQMPVVLEVTGTDLLKNAKNGVAVIDFFVYAFDEEGVVKGSVFERVRLETPLLEARLKESGVRFYTTVSLPPGRYAVKTLVRSVDTDAKGFRRVDVEVPAAGDVALLRPLFFADSGTWVMIKGGEESKVPYPFVLDGESFIPAARATLRRGEPRLFTVFVYNSRPDELTWDITPAATLVSTTGGEDVTKYVFALEHVPADTRELGVTIRRKGSADERRATVALEMQ